MRARLIVEQAGPLTSVQDGGRPGWMRYGVAASGPVDRLAFAAAQLAVGNDPADAAIELSLGGLVLRCVEGAVGFALAGGDFTATIDDGPRADWTTGLLAPGERLSVREGQAGHWAALAFAGSLVARRWLGSVATHAPAGLGGGRLVAGQEIIVDEARPLAGNPRALPRPPFADPDEIRVVMGPQDRFFTDDALAAFASSPFATSAAFDRMGMRLAGPALVPTALDMLSEPLVRGAIQVNGAGVATLLLADHQTTGGYPKIAVVIGADVDRLAQRRPDRAISFRAVTVDEAIAAARSHAAAMAPYLAAVATPSSLDERLRAANLIGGVVDAKGSGD